MKSFFVALTAALALGVRAQESCVTPLDALMMDEDLSTLLDLAEVLPDEIITALNSTTTAWTIFAPTNDAFELLGSDAPTDPEVLARVILTHVITEGAFTGAELIEGGSYPSASGAPLDIMLDAGAVTVGTANSTAEVVMADIATCSTIVHKISEVLVPAPEFLGIASDDVAAGEDGTRGLPGSEAGEDSSAMGMAASALLGAVAMGIAML